MHRKKNLDESSLVEVEKRMYILEKKYCSVTLLR